MNDNMPFLRNTKRKRFPLIQRSKSAYGETKWMRKTKSGGTCGKQMTINGLLESCLNRMIWSKDNSNGRFEKSPDFSKPRWKRIKTEMVLIVKHPSKRRQIHWNVSGKCKEIELVHVQQCTDAFTLWNTLTALSKLEMDSPSPLMDSLHIVL